MATTTFNNNQFFKPASREQAIAESNASINRTTAEISKLTQQADTGQRYSDYVDVSLAGKVEPLLNITRQLSQNKQLQASNQMISTNVEETSNLLGTLNEIVDDIRGNLISFDGNDPQILQGYLGSIQNILNTRFAGRALFSGYDTSNDAVGDIVNNSNLINNIPTDSYALTSQARSVYKINNIQTINTNIVAGDECFMKIIGAVHLALQNDGNMAAVEAMLDDGQNLLNARIVEVDNNYILLKNSTEQLKNQRLRLETEYDSVFKIDQVEAIQIAKEKGRTLQIGQLLIGDLINQNSIMDYMKR